MSAGQDHTPRGLLPHGKVTSQELSEHWRRPVVGVLGGMGPAATVAFLDLLIELTPAGQDQEHLDTVVLQHSSIPDRTAYVLDPAHAADPSPALAADAQTLQRLGCAFLTLPCNTANHFEEAIRSAVEIPLLSIVAETAAAVAAAGQHPVGILATEGTITAGVYQRELDARGVAWVIPDGHTQNLVNAIIYDQVKAGLPADAQMLEQVIEAMGHTQGAQRVILGCTELSVARITHQIPTDDAVYDSLEVLAQATLAAALPDPLNI